MASLVLETAIEVASRSQTHAAWRSTTRIAFRFCFLYFGLYVLVTQMLGGLLAFLKWEVPPLQELPPLKYPVIWTAVHVFGVTRRLVITGSGSGDKTFDWVAAFCLLVVASTATVIWSLLDRKRENYVTAHKWFHIFLRFAAGSTMLTYGMVKAFPLQMPAPYLTRLLEPFGNFSPMGVLWAAIGASPAYERFAGSAEIAAAVCLFIPRLSLVGALILLFDSVQIFTLNMTYDVPVKLFSFHLILISLVLLAPDARRLLNVLLLDRPALPSTQGPFFDRPSARRIMTGAQIVFGIYLIAMNVASARLSWYTYGGGAPRPPLYGIWDIETMTIDGVERAPLVTDYDRWRRVIVQNTNVLIFQRMDNTFVFYSAKTDDSAKTITLSKPPDAKGNARFIFDRSEPSRMTLGGEIDGRTIRMRVHLLDHQQLPLLSRGFNWIQEYPFNR
jgi:hypothetical protein